MKEQKEEKEDVKIIEADFIDVTGMYYGRNGSNKYTRRGIEIDTIVDSNGNKVKIVWQDEWVEVAFGIESGNVNNVRTIRIHREACPVRVRFRHYEEYVSYDYSEHNSSWKTFYWARYEHKENRQE